MRWLVAMSQAHCQLASGTQGKGSAASTMHPLEPGFDIGLSTHLCLPRRTQTSNTAARLQARLRGRVALQEDILLCWLP